MPSPRTTTSGSSLRPPGLLLRAVVFAAAWLACFWMAGCTFGKGHPEYERRIDQLNKTSQELPATSSSAPADKGV